MGYCCSSASMISTRRCHAPEPVSHLEEEPQTNSATGTREFALRDPDGSPPRPIFKQAKVQTTESAAAQKKMTSVTPLLRRCNSQRTDTAKQAVCTATTTRTRPRRKA